VPISPPRNPTSTPRQPSHSFAGLSPDVRGSRRDDGVSPSAAAKARSVGGGDRDRNRNRESTAQWRSLGANTLPHFPPGRGPAKGRNELVEKLVIEDEPDRVRALVLSVARAPLVHFDVEKT